MKRSDYVKVLKKLLIFVIAMVLLVVVWQVIHVIGDYPEALFPSPSTVGQEIVEMIISGILFVHLQVSLGRLAVGYLLAVIPAIILGMFLGRMPRVWQIIDPMVQVLRPVSPVAWSRSLYFGSGLEICPQSSLFLSPPFFLSF